MNEDVIRSALLVLRRLWADDSPAPDRIILLPDGGVFLEWSAGAYLEAGISEPGQVEWMREREGEFDHWTAEIGEGGKIEALPEELEP